MGWGQAMRRENRQAGFAEALVAGGGNRRLEAIEAVLDWAAVERLLYAVYAAPTGRASYPVLSLFKAVLLGAWHGLGDPELEAALCDRLSFRRFAGLALDEAVPDHSTLWRFRDQLRRLGLSEKLFAEINRQLEQNGVVVKQGTLVDATLIPAAAAEPPKQKGGGRSAADPDAAWAKRASGKAVFGYKLHAGVDAGSGIVRRARVTPANVNEITVGPELVAGDEGSVWADKAYVGPSMAGAIAAAGAKNRVQRRNQKNRRLRPSERRRNVLIGRVRGRVEGVIGALKRSYGMARLRYMSLARNATGLLLKLTGWNLARAADRLLAT
jgi:transposase, IS5 family